VRSPAACATCQECDTHGRERKTASSREIDDPVFGDSFPFPVEVIASILTYKLARTRLFKVRYAYTPSSLTNPHPSNKIDVQCVKNWLKIVYENQALCLSR